MTSSLVVPMIDAQNDNFKELWPAMVIAIKSSSFIALDTELSGLGNRTSLLAQSIEDRYKAICHAARSRSILSLGISCYKKLEGKAADTYLVQVYNLTLLCSEEYVIEPKSVQFLVQHGFDFNKQYAHGIPYCKGNNKDGSDNRGVHIRALFTELLRARKPLVLHNGLIDMVFLYQSFYAHLPEHLATFTADLSEMFPAGIYDTKYVTEFELRLTASYLEYAFKKCKLDNSRRVTSGIVGPHVHIEFCQYGGHMSTYVDYRTCPDVASLEGPTNICLQFSGFGWCPNGTQCPLSHDTDQIILLDEKSSGDKRKKRKRNREKKKGGENAEKTSSNFEGAPENKIPHMELDPAETPEPLVDTEGNTTQSEGENMKIDSEGNNACDSVTSAPTDDDMKTNTDDGEDVQAKDGGRTKPSDLQSESNNHNTKTDTGTHRAGFDAFMTGYIFAYSHAQIKRDKGGAEEEKEQKEEQTWLPSCLNKIYLSGKAAPLNVVKSTFSKSSRAHMLKMEMVWGKKF
ncbi:target of EGR1 protein 1 [Halichoeres trimaculatus]|uniref:target of EGR1 protein 1 n=1 Tax=Halichoeres trimaculatus TaxID=147232 RepID=UPI003D9F298F